MINKIIMTLMISVLLAGLFISCEDTDFQGLYKPREVGDTRPYKCKNKPSGDATEWNVVSEYTQSWNGTSWEPADDPVTDYSEYGTETSCQFKCAITYVWNYSECVKDTENLYKTYYCQPKPEGEEYVWNIVSEYTQKSSDQGASWYPYDDPDTEYNDSPSTTSCQFKCATGFVWNGSACTKAATGTKTFICNPLPDTNGAYVWNAVDRYNQDTYDEGATWTPDDDPVTEYNEEASTTSCRFKCNAGYSWNGSACIYLSWEYAAGYNWMKALSPMTYANGQTFCNSNGGSFPNIDQMRLIIQNCGETISGGTCQITSSCNSENDCHTTACECIQGAYDYCVLNEGDFFGEFWTSTLVIDVTTSVWTVNFSNAAINIRNYETGGESGVLCVK